MKAGLNGQTTTLLRDQDFLVAEYSPPGGREPSILTISRPSCPWQARVPGMSPSHLSLHSAGDQADFAFFWWQDKDLLFFAGSDLVYALSGKNGRVSACLPLSFTDQSSLDVLRILPNASRNKLIVLSTKVAWLWDPDGEIHKMAIPGLAVSVELAREGFQIGYLDTAKVDLPVSKLIVE